MEQPLDLRQKLVVLMQRMACDDSLPTKCPARYPDRPVDWCRNCRMAVAAEMLRASPGAGATTHAPCAERYPGMPSDWCRRCRLDEQ